jgi:type IV pilus assembly protein PilV
MNHRVHRARPSAPAQQRGGFLLEALVGILIFSFGILGLVGLQANAIRHVNDAQYRGEAVYLASTIVGRMWTDNLAQLEANYDTDLGGPGYLALKELVKTLPGATIAGNEPDIQIVPGPSANSAVATVTIFWQLPGEAQPHNYSTTAVVGSN